MSPKNYNGNYENSLKSWVLQEQYANEFINVIYKLFYDKSIELVFFRNQLIDRSSSVILYRHSYAENIIDKKLDIKDSLELAKAILHCNVKPARIDIGVHEYPTITDVEDKIITLTKFVLFQNYPNPFNPTTTISYSLSNSANVKISIFNSVGQLVKVLYNNLQTIGNHSVEWNATNASSGVYFYKVEAGTSVAVKRCLIVK